MLRIVAVSTRGDRYLVDNPSVHPINPPGQYDSPVPDGVGAEFATLDEVQHYTQTELGYLSCYYQVFIVDRAGATVLRGWRTGRGGTGTGWAWSHLYEREDEERTRP